MPYALNWLDDGQTMLVISADGQITWAEYHAINEEALRRIAVSPHRVDLIFNSKPGLPPGSPLPHFRAMIAKWVATPNLGVIVGIEASRMSSYIRASVEIAGQLMGYSMPERGTFVATLNEAVAYIKARRADSADAPQEAPTLKKQ